MKTIVFPSPPVAIFVAVVISGCCGRPSAVAGPPQGRDLAAAEIDPAPDVLADRSNGDEDRNKRQLSSVQNRLLNFLKPLPVVDVTREEDKYGNDGDKFNRIGRSFIGGVESISSMLSSALSVPVDAAKRLSKSATDMLNNLGGRIVGLQR